MTQPLKLAKIALLHLATAISLLKHSPGILLRGLTRDHGAEATEEVTGGRRSPEEEAAAAAGRWRRLEGGALARRSAGAGARRPLRRSESSRSREDMVLFATPRTTAPGLLVSGLGVMP